MALEANHLKLVLGSLAATIVLALAPTAGAGESTGNLMVGGGYSAPLSPNDFKDYWPSGYHVGAMALIGSGEQEQVHGGLMVWHHRFAFDSDKFKSSQPPTSVDVKIDGGTTCLTEIGLVGRYDFVPGKVRPYVIGSLGYAILAATDVTMSTPTLSRTLSFNTDSGLFGSVGAGLAVSVGPVWLIAQVRYSLVLTEGDNTTFVPITGGIMF
jgi:hypothetical protein